MDENYSLPSSSTTSGPKSTVDEKSGSSRGPIIIAAVVGIIILAVLVVGVILLIGAPLDTTARVRDIFIIFMALEFLVIGLALVVLMVQLATLINLLQNEMKPILESTKETVNTLRGTTAFLSDNLAEPVIKLNEYLAALKRMLDLLHIVRR